MAQSAYPVDIKQVAATTATFIKDYAVLGIVIGKGVCNWH